MGGIAFERVKDSCAHAASGASRSALNLEPCSLGDHSGPGWSLTVLDFGGGAVEARAVWCDSSRSQRSPTVRTSEAGSPPESSPERLLRSVMRSRRNLRHRVLALGADRMITLTKRGKFESLDDAWSAFARFNRVCSKFYGPKWAYVCVPEMHADGTFHLHLAVRGRYWVGLLRKFWFKALGGVGNERGEDTPGNIHISEPRHRGRGGRRRIAGYMAKYLGKDLSQGFSGRRAFATSGRLAPRQVTRLRVPLTLGSCGAYELLTRLRSLYPGLTFRSRNWNVGTVAGITFWTDV